MRKLKKQIIEVFFTLFIPEFDLEMESFFKKLRKTLIVFMQEKISKLFQNTFFGPLEEIPLKLKLKFKFKFKI